MEGVPGSENVGEWHPRVRVLWDRLPDRPAAVSVQTQSVQFLRTLEGPVEVLLPANKWPLHMQVTAEFLGSLPSGCWLDARGLRIDLHCADGVWAQYVPMYREPGGIFFLQFNGGYPR